MGAELNVHPVGLNAEEQKILSVAMNVLLAAGCGIKLSDHMTGETVVVVDVDSDEGRAFYESHHDSHRAVIIAADERNYHADALIRKPLRVQTLRNMLSEMSEEATVQGVQGMSTSSSVSPSASSSSETLPNSSLFYAMVNAVATGTLLKLTARGTSSPILLHGPSRHLYSNLEREQIAQVAALNGDAITITSLDEFAFMKEARSVHSYRLERLLWLAAKKGASGIAPVNAADKNFFHLTEWPRFDIKATNPAYLSLAAIMTRHTLSCHSLARMAGIPVETAYDFYHAVKACGVLKEVVLPQQKLVEKPVEQTKKSSLVSRIASKLGISLV